MQVPPPASETRWLLCASAAHCARVLHAAASTRMHLHGLHPCTHWPAKATGLLLWALLPAPCAAHAALEQQWRSHLLTAGKDLRVHMLYGSAAQQAQQLAPWIHHPPSPDTAIPSPDCWECVDAASEQQLFQHLLQRP